MDNKARNKAAFMVVMCLVLAFLAWNNFVAPVVRRMALRHIVSSPVQPQANVSQAAASGTGDVVSDGSTKVVDYEGMKWMRNPFRMSETAFVQEASKDSKTLDLPVPEFTLEGIIWDTERPYAIINGELCGQGDLIQSFEIVVIEKDKVILRRGDQNIVLKLFS